MVVKEMRGALPVSNNKNSKKQKKQKQSGVTAPQINLKSLANALKPVVKQALVSGGTALGGLAGAQVGAPLQGSQLGGLLGAKLSKLIGSGDYVSNGLVQSNSMFLPGEVISKQRNLSPHGIRIRHREYIGDISGVANTFTTNIFAVNPALPATFPWLSSVANLYERYHVHGMAFEFVSTTSEYFATSAMGSVIMAMQYDTGSTMYTSKRVMENSDEAISFRPDKSAVYGVECKNFAQNWYYTRSSSVFTDPLSSCDIGNMVVATASPLTSVLGELWVCYDIELDRPDLSATSAGALSFVKAGNTSAQDLAFNTIGTFPLSVTNSINYGIQNNSYVVNAANQGIFVITGASVGDIIEILVCVRRNNASAKTNYTASIGAGAQLVSSFAGITGNLQSIEYAPSTTSVATESYNMIAMACWAVGGPITLNLGYISTTELAFMTLHVSKIGWSVSAPSSF